MNKTYLAILFAFAMLLSPSLVQAQRKLLPIDDFDGGIQNRLGGYRNTFERAPSSADAMRVPEARYGRYGAGLCITAERLATGFCGYWIHFFDMNAPVRQYVDATDYEFLSFRIKGTLGAEQFTVKLADERQIEKEDAIALGTIDEFLPGGVTTDWQEVLVPLKGDHGLTLDRLGGLTLDFDQPGKATVFVDNVALKSGRAVKIPDVDPNANAANAEPSTPATRFERALWLWSTETMLDDPTQAEALFAFCATHGISHVWAQLLYDIKEQREGNRVVESTCSIRREAAFRRFLKHAHIAGVQVHALEGYPEHAQREYHRISLAIVDAVIAFNENHSPQEQFDGIHFDNEPHLLVGWHDPRRREQILFEFLTLNHECQRRVRAASASLQFGVDIPFWLQDPAEGGTEAIGAVSFNGRRQAASYHLLEMLDNVGVMNYRDTAQGADGLIAHGRDLLEHADRVSKAKVFMGVETFAYTPTDVLFAVGRPRAEFQDAVRSEACDVSKLSRVDGHRLRVFDDGENVHIGIEIADALTLSQRIAIAHTISNLAAAFGVNHISDAEHGESIQEALRQSLVQAKDWSDVTPLSVRDPATGETHRLVKATAAMLDKITFADENEKRFSSQINAAEEYFSKHKSYAGIAIHHYDSYRDLLESGAKPSLTAH